MEREEWRIGIVVICSILQLVGFVCLVFAINLGVGGNPPTAIVLWLITAVGGFAAVVKALFSGEYTHWRKATQVIAGFCGVGIVVFSVEKIFSLL